MQKWYSNINGDKMEEKKIGEFKKSNAKRFLDAYNDIDYSLKTRYNFNRSMGFSDLIRKTVSLNYIIRKYEDELIDYGRLRNAIIHNNNEDFIIAEPHEQVVNEIEHIRKLLSTPPKALDTCAMTNVLVTSAEKSMREVIILMAQSNFSNIPVYKGNELIGVANGQKILTAFGQYMLSGGKCSAFLDNVQIEDMLSTLQDSKYFVVKDSNCTIEEALREFDENHKLLAILFTRHGQINERALGIMTGRDVTTAQKILENY